MLNPITMNAFADELNKLASVVMYDEEIEKLAELEVIAQQLSCEYDITKEAAYELMKEAGIGAMARAAGAAAKRLLPTSTGAVARAAAKPQMAKALAAKAVPMRGIKGFATRGAVPKGIPVRGRAAQRFAQSRTGSNVAAGRMI